MRTLFVLGLLVLVFAGSGRRRASVAPNREGRYPVQAGKLYRVIVVFGSVEQADGFVGEWTRDGRPLERLDGWRVSVVVQPDQTTTLGEPVSPTHGGRVESVEEVTP